MSYYGKQATDEGKMGQAIYHEVLSDRRGFRPDQIGIDEGDEIWAEIFDDIGHAVMTNQHILGLRSE